MTPFMDRPCQIILSHQDLDNSALTINASPDFPLSPETRRLINKWGLNIHHNFNFVFSINFVDVDSFSYKSIS